MLCGAAGMVVMLLFGKIPDSLNSTSLGALPVGFAITFISAVFFGIVSLHFLKKISEPPQVHVKDHHDTSHRLLLLPMSGRISGIFLYSPFFGAFRSISPALFLRCIFSATLNSVTVLSLF